MSVFRRVHCLFQGCQYLEEFIVCFRDVSIWKSSLYDSAIPLFGRVHCLFRGFLYLEELNSMFQDLEEFTVCVGDVCINPYPCWNRKLLAFVTSIEPDQPAHPSSLTRLSTVGLITSNSTFDISTIENGQFQNWNFEKSILKNSAQ